MGDAHGGTPVPELSVVIPTLDRADVLQRTLQSLLGQEPPPWGAEIIVVDNGSTDRTQALLAATAGVPGIDYRTSVVRRPGPAAARNAGVRLARGASVLFLGDDTAPARPGFLRGHCEALRAAGEGAGVLGGVEWADPAAVGPFMLWLTTSGLQFDLADLEPGLVDLERFFYTANVSLPIAWLRQAGGFDERFTDAAVEDIELGGRLAAAGMGLRYRPDLLVRHDHHTTYAASLRRTVRVGRSARRYRDLFPDRPHPGLRAPGVVKRGVYATVSRAVAWRRPGERLPSPLRELRWTLAHRHAYVLGLRGPG